MDSTPENIAHEMDPDPFSDTESESRRFKEFYELDRNEAAMLRAANVNNLRVEVANDGSDHDGSWIEAIVNGVAVRIFYDTQVIGAFYYLDSPTARVQIVKCINDTLDDFEVHDEH